MNSRLKNLYYKLEKHSLDGLLVSSPANITYLTGYPSRDSLLLVSKKENFYFTDSRYVREASLALKGIATLKEIDGSIFKLIAGACKQCGLKVVGFEERNVSVAEFKKLHEGLTKSIKLIPTYGLIEGLRQLKQPQEVKKISQAIQITAQAFEFIQKFALAGKTELEVAGELERFIRYKGASGPAFETIVASGPNSSFPHHIPTKKLIKAREPVLIDMGVEYMGYKSDLTRVFFLDKINGQFQKVYATVLEAQNQAIKLIKPGVRLADIDAASRNYISAKGLGKFFGHSLGHGVGLEIHENPRVSAKEKEVLAPGMVFTVEPAVYLPGKFGIRIEDMVLVTERNCEVLSGSIHK